MAVIIMLGGSLRFALCVLIAMQPLLVHAASGISQGLFIRYRQALEQDYPNIKNTVEENTVEEVARVCSPDLATITTRPAKTSSLPKVFLVRNSGELLDIFFKYSLVGAPAPNVVFLMPDSVYELPSGLSIQTPAGADSNTDYQLTFCGIGHLPGIGNPGKNLSESSPASFEGERGLQPAGATDRDQLTKLVFLNRASPERRPPSVYEIGFGQHNFLNLDIDISRADTTRVREMDLEYEAGFTFGIGNDQPGLQLINSYFSDHSSGQRDLIYEGAHSNAVLFIIDSLLDSNSSGKILSLARCNNQQIHGSVFIHQNQKAREMVWLGPCEFHQEAFPKWAGNFFLAPEIVNYTALHFNYLAYWMPGYPDSRLLQVANNTFAKQVFLPVRNTRAIAWDNNWGAVASQSDGNLWSGHEGQKACEGFLEHNGITFRHNQGCPVIPHEVKGGQR